MDIGTVAATDLFVGTEQEPRQVVRVTIIGDRPEPVRVRIRGERVTTSQDAVIDAGTDKEATVEVGITVSGEVVEGDLLNVEVVADTEHDRAERSVRIAAAEPGWRMFMVSHFHYDPVWWNTQASYTESWKRAGVGDEQPWVRPFQQPGLTLVHEHLEMARRDPDYSFVLAELDYLKPYWDVFPEDRAYVRQLLADGRLELMGGTYNEPNTNLTAAENTARNAVYGVAYQRDVLGGTPATAWQLDVFGHDPQFPGMMADAGLSSSSWARGPFHEWGPRWNRGPESIEAPPGCDDAAMQFASEFNWTSPSGMALLTAYMANHYSAGWWMDSAASLSDAEEETYRLFSELKEVAATKNVLLPVGTDYSPPNKWVTEIQRDWNARYVWPQFVSATPREFFAAARAEMENRQGFSPQTRDMNPVYTGKDVSYIDTKQAQRDGENTLLAAEKFSTIAALLGARYPTEAFDKAWRQLLFGAHHDGITGSESDQVYLDLLGGWREALELSREALDGALGHIGRHVDTSGDGLAVTVFNPMSWVRTDVTRVELRFDGVTTAGVTLRDDAGRDVPFVIEREERHGDGSLAAVALVFLAEGVPALGYRTYWAVPARELATSAVWSRQQGDAIENDRYRVEVAGERGGAIVRLLDKQAGKDLLRPGGLGNELLAYGEYADHPRFMEGPWHLTPDGSVTSSADVSAEVVSEQSAVGQRIRVTGGFAGCHRTQEIVLWSGVDRVELRTHLDDYRSQDTLFRVRFAADVEGGMPVSEVGNAVIGRGFGFPNVDVAEVPFTLDYPAYNWFALSATARVALADGAEPPHATRALSVAEVVVAEGATGAQATVDVVTALVRAGVTATVSADSAGRYGCSALDSNLPDVRIALGGPDRNRFSQQVLADAGSRYADELRSQLAERGSARVWVPADRPLRDVWRPNADLRGLRDLPVLIVAGEEQDVLDALIGDLDDNVIEVRQPAELDQQTGRVEDYSVAVLNRGLPGCNVESDGSMYLSLMRSCSGWPSGIWIDPPRRTAPDGSNFQFQHWSHTFEYAIAGRTGDWRSGEVVHAGHDYNNPLLARAFEPHAGTLPASASLVEVSPSTVVCTALKPTGHPMARMQEPEMDPADGVSLRLYESAGRPTRATVQFYSGLRDGFRSDLLEERRAAASVVDGELVVDLDGYGIATVGGIPNPIDGLGMDGVELATRVEAAQPVFSDYWMHNRGVAPLGYQPVTVQVRPAALRTSEPFTLPVVVASERTDAAVAGRVQLALPPGWHADPPERIYRLEPGGYMSFEAKVRPAQGASPGRYFLAARITDHAGQVHEDVVTVDYGNPPEWDTDTGAAADSLILDRINRKASVIEGHGSGWPQLGGELVAELSTDSVNVAPGERGELSLQLHNLAASPLHGEAQILSPYETWEMVGPWTQGFAVQPGGYEVLAFTIKVPADFRAGTYWALVKLMYYGRMIYTESVPLVIGKA